MPSGGQHHPAQNNFLAVFELAALGAGRRARRASASAICCSMVRVVRPVCSCEVLSSVVGVVRGIVRVFSGSVPSQAQRGWLAFAAARIISSEHEQCKGAAAARAKASAHLRLARFADARLRKSRARGRLSLRPSSVGPRRKGKTPADPLTDRPFAALGRERKPRRAALLARKKAAAEKGREVVRVMAIYHCSTKPLAAAPAGARWRPPLTGQATA